ncbi:hypothetical protein M902_3014 [Bacteriovorax sp. BAL6_X]|nr:hypothetical protein M902_3014 [Bacteriovorax sp. BAL6_X]
MYVGNTPLASIDPFGLFSMECLIKRGWNNFRTTTNTIGLSWSSLGQDLIGLPFGAGLIGDLIENGELTNFQGGSISSGFASMGTLKKSKKSFSKIFSVALKRGGRVGISNLARQAALKTAVAANAMSVIAGYGSFTVGVALGSFGEAVAHELFGFGYDDSSDCKDCK